MSKTYRIREEFAEIVENKRIDMIVETRENIAEADVINATLWKYLNSINSKDVLLYKEQSEDKRRKRK